MPAVIEKIRPVKVGFRGSAMMRAEARGKVFDPNEIVRVEVLVVSDAKEDLFSSQTLALVRNAVNGLRFRGGRVVARGVGEQTRKGWCRWFDVD